MLDHASPYWINPDRLVHDHGWIVETATRRVVRRRCAACAIEAAQASDLEVRARARGLERSETMKVLKQIEEALEDAAAVIEPAEADLRVVEPEEIHEPPPVHLRQQREHIPAGADPRPLPHSLPDLRR